MWLYNEADGLDPGALIMACWILYRSLNTVCVVFASETIMLSEILHFYIAQRRFFHRTAVLARAVLEYCISDKHTLFALVRSVWVIILILVLVFVEKYSGTSPSTDILWYILWHKGENHHIREINSWLSKKGKVANWFIWLWFEYMSHGMWL